MTQYIFQLGTFPELSLAELRLVFSQAVFTQLTANLYQVELTTPIDESAVLANLGGAVKILKVLTQLSADQDVSAAITAQLTKHQRPTFSVTLFNFSADMTLDPADIKKQLKSRGTASRYVESGAHGLPSANFQTKMVLELYAIKTQTGILIAQTVAVQLIKAWVSRDRYKPYANRRKGMLPPKVARMMVNIAQGLIDRDQTQPLIYDPFCGTGTILMEAVLSGCRVVGSDIDAQAVAGSQANLNWLAGETQTEFNQQLFVHDISTPGFKTPGSKLSRLKGQVQAIITEPFMGKPKPRTENLPNIFRGLEKLYLGTFKNLKPLLCPNSVVIFIFPAAQIGERTFSMAGLIDKLGSLGYTTCLEPLWYYRPDAVIKRQIVAFRFESK